MQGKTLVSCLAPFMHMQVRVWSKGLHNASCWNAIIGNSGVRNIETNRHFCDPYRPSARAYIQTTHNYIPLMSCDHGSATRNIHTSRTRKCNPFDQTLCHMCMKGAGHETRKTLTYPTKLTVFSCCRQGNVRRTSSTLGQSCWIHCCLPENVFFIKERTLFRRGSSFSYSFLSFSTL